MYEIWALKKEFQKTARICPHMILLFKTWWTLIKLLGSFRKWL